VAREVDAEQRAERRLPVHEVEEIGLSGRRFALELAAAEEGEREPEALRRVHVEADTVARLAAADVVVWATGAAPAPILRAVDLPKDGAGFLQVTDSLHSPADPTVFAVGDSAAFVTQPVAKAGVYAVREGAVLLENIRRTLEAVPLRPFSPQSGEKGLTESAACVSVHFETLAAEVTACALFHWRRPGASHILKIPNRVGSGFGALNPARSAWPSTARVSAGSMTPSSHNRAVA